MSSAELTVPADPAFVGLVRLVVAQAARQAGVRQARVEDVKIAVHEVLATAVRARHAAQAQRPITVVLGPTARGFEVVVRDVDDLTTPPVESPTTAVDLLDPKLSFTLVEGLTDAVDYEREGTMTNLRFVIAFD